MPIFVCRWYLVSLLYSFVRSFSLSYPCSFCIRCGTNMEDTSWHSQELSACSRSVSCFLFHCILFHSIFHFTWLLWLSSLVAMMLCVCHQQRRTCFIVNDNKYLSYNLDFVYGCQNAVMYVSWQKRIERENEAQRVKGTTMWKLNDNYSNNKSTVANKI